MEYSRTKIINFLSWCINLCAQGILVVFIGSALYSCTSLRDISIEVAVLPQYPISEDIQSLVLLNRSINMKFSNIRSDSLEKILVNRNMELDTVFQDSIAADTVIQVAANALFESGRFDVVVPKEQNIVRADNEDISNPLNISYITNICKNFNVDALLVLESFSEQLSTKYTLIRDQGNYYGAKEYDAATDIDYKSDWRLYRPNDQKSSLRFQVSDSIFWKANNFSLKDLYAQMPRTKDALIGGGIAAGLKMAGFISPNWVDQIRYYFMTGKPEIDAAVTLIKENKWEEAAVIWAKYEKSDSKVIRSKVQFNLALAAEMSGNLDLAIEWGLKSFNTHYSKTIEVYLKTLDANRKAKLKESKQRF